MALGLELGSSRERGVSQIRVLDVHHEIGIDGLLRAGHDDRFPEREGDVRSSRLALGQAGFHRLSYVLGNDVLGGDSGRGGEAEQETGAENSSDMFFHRDRFSSEGIYHLSSEFYLQCSCQAEFQRSLHRRLRLAFPIVNIRYIAGRPESSGREPAGPANISVFRMRMQIRALNHLLRRRNPRREDGCRRRGTKDHGRSTAGPNGPIIFFDRRGRRVDDPSTSG